jgi:hypothetical protein
LQKTGNRVYFIIDQTDLGVPGNWSKNDGLQLARARLGLYLSDNRGTPGSAAFVETALKKYFSHTIMLSDTDGGFYRASPAFTFGDNLFTERDVRGTYILTSPLSAEAAKIAVPVLGYDAVALAHEYMHLVMHVNRGVGAWDVNEHLMPQFDPGGVDVMSVARATNMTLGTVQILPVTQQEIDFAGNENLQP